MNSHTPDQKPSPAIAELPAPCGVVCSALFGVMFAIAAGFLCWQLWPLWSNVIKPLIEINQTMSHIEETMDKMKTTNGK